MEVLTTYDILQEVSGLIVVLILSSLTFLIRHCTKGEIEEKLRGAKGTSRDRWNVLISSPII